MRREKSFWIFVLYLNARPKLTLGVNVSLCCRNALNKEVLSFPQHAPKQWFYCMMAKMESTVPLSSAAIIAQTENRKGKSNSALGKKKSQFSVWIVHLFHTNTFCKERSRGAGKAQQDQSNSKFQSKELFYNSKCTEKWRNMRINCHWKQWELQICSKFGK